jgi:hypothetical protein
MRQVRALGRFWFDFVVGEDWRIAAGVAAVLAVGAVLASAGAVRDGVLVVLVAGAIVLVVVASVVGTALRSGSSGPPARRR